MSPIAFFDHIYASLLSDKTQKRSEQIILIVAIISFLIHLILIILVDNGVLQLEKTSDLLQNPIAAIYTPFSFILVYEVYLLIYYLPRSITTYITKQYEIITLIIIRRLFKDLSALTLSPDWFKIRYDLQFTYDLIASVLLFYLIYLFYIQSGQGKTADYRIHRETEGIHKFIKIKKILAATLVPVILCVAGYSLITWFSGIFANYGESGVSFENINNIFFEEFFTILIIADVILLLISFFYTDEFHKVIRNSGFIISTILIRLSFSVEGLINTILIVTAMVFGLVILVIHNQFEKRLELQNTKSAQSDT